MIYIIYIQRFTSVHLKPNFNLIYINLDNLHLYFNTFIICLVQRIEPPRTGISAIEKQFYYLHQRVLYYLIYNIYITVIMCKNIGTLRVHPCFM